MFHDYESYLNESENAERIHKLIIKNSELSEVLNKAIEGFYSHIQVIVTEGVTSYVGVALNDGESISEVYKTADPKVALVSIIIKNSGRKDVENLISLITTEDNYLAYSVFPGNRPMSQQEVADRFNFDYKVPPGDAVPFYTSTPIKKVY